MQSYNPYNLPNQQYFQPLSPNAVNINIISPQAYSGPCYNTTNPNSGFYSMYGQNPNPALPYYPQNYNNMYMTQPQNQQSPLSNATNMVSNPKMVDKTENEPVKDDKKDEDKKETTKKEITPLTDEYIKSLENYLDNNNSKIRLIAAKELMERFKESDERKDNPSLIPLLNKILQDPSPAVRFLGLATLQSGYCVGDNETVKILQQIQNENKDKIGEDALLASEILLKMSAPQKQEIISEEEKK